MKEKNPKIIHITPIKEGTAIDHLKPGTALKILEVLNLQDVAVTAAMNVESRKMGRKDIIFIDGKKLNERELNKVALIGKGGTLNEIRNGKIVAKKQLAYPDRAEGIIKCINPKCITNTEPLPTKFSISGEPLSANCFYCQTRMKGTEIANSII